MKNLFIIFLILCFYSPMYCIAQEENQTLLKAEISMVPKSFYGTWRVQSKRIETDAPYIFSESGIDIWNLSRTYDVITLCNLFNGAKAEITVHSADANHVIFVKNGKHDKKVLSDRVEIKINGDTFEGIDTLKLDTYENGKVMKSETAKYSLKGEKIGGQIGAD